MKRIALLTLTCLLSLSNFAQNKLGYIDSQELLLLLPERKTAESEVQTFAKSLESQLQAMTNEQKTNQITASKHILKQITNWHLGS